MNILNDKLDLEKMYKYQLENIDIENFFKDELSNINKDYEKYLKYLSFFFLKSSSNDQSKSKPILIRCSELFIEFFPTR